MTPKRLGIHSPNAIGFHATATMFAAFISPTLIGTLARTSSIEVLLPVMLVAMAVFTTLFEVLMAYDRSRARDQQVESSTPAVVGA